MIRNNNNNNNHRNNNIKSLDSIIDELSIGWFHYRLLIISGLAFMADGMEVSLLSFMSTCAGVDWNLTHYQMALITSVVFIGQLIGSSFFGPLSDAYGRHKAFALSSIIITLGGILSGVATNYTSLLIYRALVGFGVGGAFVPYDLLAEFLPNSHRGRFLIYIELFWTIGSMFVAGTAWLCLSTFGWRVLALITAIPVALASLGCVLLLPESPRWLIIKGRPEEAKEILINAAKINQQEIDDDFILSTDIDPDKNPSIFEFLQPDHRNISIPLWIIWMCFGFSYYGIILFIGRIFNTTASETESGTISGGTDLSLLSSSSSPSLLSSYSSNEELVCEFNYSAIFLSAMSEILGVGITAILIDSFGRITTQSCLYAGSSISVLLMGLNFPHITLIILSICARICIMGSSSATWVITPELFTTELRSSGHSIANCMARVGAFIVPFIINSKQLTHLHVSIILSIICGIATITSFFLPETAGRDIDEIKNPNRIDRILNKINNKTQSPDSDSEMNDSERSINMNDNIQLLQKQQKQNQQRQQQN